MRGFSLPSISIPSNISIPNISFSGNGIDTGAIKSAIESAIPDLSNVTAGIDLEGAASSLIQEQIGEGIELPSELNGLIK